MRDRDRTEPRSRQRGSECHRNCAASPTWEASSAGIGLGKLARYLDIGNRQRSAAHVADHDTLRATGSPTPVVSEIQTGRYAYYRGAVGGRDFADKHLSVTRLQINLKV